MKFPLARFISSCCAVIPMVLLPSCDPERFSSTLNKGYMDGLGENAGAQTTIPWDMRIGQGYWDDPGDAGGPAKIVINRPEQKAYFYRGHVIVGMTPVSVGSEGYDTPAGNYKIQEKKRMHISGTWGVAKNRATGETVIKDFNLKKDKLPAGCYAEGAQMPYALRIVGGYFMHVGYVPGYAASHGCIRVPADMAEKFWTNASVGTPVQII